jgi:hypothetical protein
MYSQRTSLIIGFHGCDESVRDALVNSKNAFKKSENTYDWLGHGMYFWDNDPERALEFAQFKKKNPKTSSHPIKKPSVVGAVINLGLCLDLVSSKSLQLLKVGHEILCRELSNSGLIIPQNKPLKDGVDLVFRNLDCAVIEMLHQYRHKSGFPPFDSVRGVFWEGNDLYENAGFKEKNHMQICIRNPNCIKGFFIPREADNSYSTP